MSWIERLPGEYKDKSFKIALIYALYYVRSYIEESARNIIIARVDGQVRVFAQDGTDVGEVVVDGKDDVIIEGNIGTVTIMANDITVTAINAEIGSASINTLSYNFVFLALTLLTAVSAAIALNEI